MIRNATVIVLALLLLAFAVAILAGIGCTGEASRRTATDNFRKWAEHMHLNVATVECNINTGEDSYASCTYTVVGHEDDVHAIECGSNLVGWNHGCRVPIAPAAAQ